NALVAASRHVVRMWYLAGTGEKHILSGHNKAITGLAFSPDGKLLASAGDDPVVRIWDSMTGQLLKQLPYFHSGGSKLAFSADGMKLAAAAEGAVQIWDVPSWRKLAALTDPELGSSIGSLAFSPNGHYLAACGCERGGLTLWGIKPGD